MPDGLPSGSFLPKDGNFTKPAIILNLWQRCEKINISFLILMTNVNDGWFCYCWNVRVGTRLGLFKN